MKLLNIVDETFVHLSDISGKFYVTAIIGVYLFTYLMTESIGYLTLKVVHDKFAVV